MQLIYYIVHLTLDSIRTTLKYHIDFDEPFLPINLCTDKCGCLNFFCFCNLILGFCSLNYCLLSKEFLSLSKCLLYC